MSVSSIIDPATGQIYDDLIPQGGGVPLAKGQLISADALGREVAVPTGANGTILSADPAQDDGLRWIAVPGATPLAQGQLLSANLAGDATIVVAPNLPAQAGWVLSADGTAGAVGTNMAWKPPTGGGGVLTANLPLFDDATTTPNKIGINFTAVKGEIPAGNGTATEGALVPAPPTNGYVLTAESSEATGLKWLPAGSGPAQTNFFRLTVPANAPFTTSGVEIELPAPNTIGTFTDNEQITIMNYEIPASSANTFSFPSLPFMGASYGATGTDANNQTCWFVEDYGGIGCFLLKAELPLSANTNELVWGVFSNTPATSGNIGNAYVSGIVATTDYVYFYGYFDEFNTASGATPIAVLTNCGNIVRYEKATGTFSKLDTGGLVYSGNGGSGEICSVCVCPTDDKSLGNYLSNPKTLVLGGSFTETLGGALACPYIAFYDEGTNTFSIVGDQAGDGITAPAPVAVSGIPTYYITSLVYNTNTNALLVSMNKVDYTWTIGGVPFVQYNGITSFGWKIAPVSTALSLGTAGQILNPSNRGIGIGIVFSAVGGKYWLLIGYTDTAGTNCWWKLLDEPVGNAFLDPTSPLPPLQYRGASGTTCDIPQQLLYGRNSSTSENQSPVPFVNPPVDGSASRLIWIDDTANSTYVAFYNEGADTTSSIQQFISSATTAGSWTAIAKSQDQFAVNQSLLPSIVLLFGANSQGQSLVADTAFVGILYIPSGITYYSASGTGGVATATKVKFGSSYSSIQASVDTTANTYRLVNNYGNIQFS